MKHFSRILFILFFTLTANAHEVRPAYFSVTQISDSTFQVVWKLPALGEAIPKIYPVLPDSWVIIDEQSNLLPGNLRRTYTLQINKSIGGQTLLFDGLQKTLIDVLISIKMKNGEQYSSILKPSNPTYLIPLTPEPWSVIKTYTILGADHIWFGFDHLLFVLALVLITKGTWRIIKTITAFTIAHSITLGLAVLNIISIPIAPVEAVIALSILFLAVEIIHIQQGKKSFTANNPWVVAFVFGLLHGLGFASALTQVGLPQGEIPLALAFFNIGVELGQLVFVFVVLMFIQVLNKLKIKWPTWSLKAPAFIIGSLASFWLIERFVGFF